MITSHQKPGLANRTERSEQLANERMRHGKVAVLLMLPMMVLVAYQVLTQRSIVDRGNATPGLRAAPAASTRVDEDQAHRIPPPGSASSDVAPNPRVGIRIDPNTATWPELMVLPGVGEVTAKKIVAFREERSAEDPPRFRCAADLDAIPGIGPRTIEKLIPYLSIPATCDDPAHEITGAGSFREGEAPAEPGLRRILGLP